MATSHSLKAETRACGSGNLKQLRSQGLVPGVVYGPGFDNVNIQVDAREFSRMLASAVSEHILVALDIDGKVVKVVDFGAFVNFMGGKDGLVHISELADQRVAKTSDVVSEGQQVKVLMIGSDDRGKVKLSMKRVNQETGEILPQKEKTPEKKEKKLLKAAQNYYLLLEFHKFIMEMKPLDH